MAGIDNERPVVARESSIVRIAKAIKDSAGGLWDFGQEYAVLNREANFNYRALARAVKDQHGVDLYPPSVATKLRKTYEKYVLECRIPLDIIKEYSPYYLYEIMVLTEVTPDNVHQWLEQARNKPRSDLLTEIRDGPTGTKKEPLAMLRIPENVYEMLDEAKVHLGQSVGIRDLSTTVFMEFVTELVKNTHGPQLRRLWDAIHGDVTED